MLLTNPEEFNRDFGGYYGGIGPLTYGRMGRIV